MSESHELYIWLEGNFQRLPKIEARVAPAATITITHTAPNTQFSTRGGAHTTAQASKR